MRQDHIFELKKHIVSCLQIASLMAAAWPVAVFAQNPGQEKMDSSAIELMASDPSEGDKFGFSTALSGNTAVIGARFGDGATDETGAVYLYERDVATTTWTQIIKLISGSTNFFEFFGYSVAIDGDTVVVGVIYGESDVWSSGCAFVFDRNSGGSNAWGEVQKLSASDAAGGDKFGYSVAIHGDIIVVGAPEKNDNDTNDGAAYIFQRNQGGANAWGQVTKIMATDAGYNRFLGAGVSVTQNIVAVGAPEQTGPGSVYLFGKDTGGIDSWGQIMKLTGSDPDPWDEFGSSLALDEGTLLVGCSGPIGGDGEVYIFEEDESKQWTETKRITNPEDPTSDNFGASVTLSGNLAVVGASNPEGCSSSQEAAYVYRRNQGGPDNWGLIETISAATFSGSFGAAVALDGRTLVIGAPCDDETAIDAGKAYVYQNLPLIFDDDFESGDLSYWSN